MARVTRVFGRATPSATAVCIGSEVLPAREKQGTGCVRRLAGAPGLVGPEPSPSHGHPAGLGPDARRRRYVDKLPPLARNSPVAHVWRREYPVGGGREGKGKQTLAGGFCRADSAGCGPGYAPSCGRRVAKCEFRYSARIFKDALENFPQMFPQMSGRGRGCERDGKQGGPGEPPPRPPGKGLDPPRLRPTSSKHHELRKGHSGRETSGRLPSGEGFMGRT
jgi:hypothetical protein